MQGHEIAKKHFEAAMREAESAKADPDAVARYLLGMVVQQYLRARSIRDVQSELRFVADNCDPDTDYEFMRP